MPQLSKAAACGFLMFTHVVLGAIVSEFKIALLCECEYILEYVIFELPLYR